MSDCGTPGCGDGCGDAGQCGMQNNIRFGRMEEDAYHRNDGTFSVKTDPATPFAHDNEMGVMFAGMDGSFRVVELLDIPEDQRSVREEMKDEHYLAAVSEQLLIPKRINGVYGELEAEQKEMLKLPETTGACVVGTIPGGSNYAEHHPDGTSKQIDLRIGMLAFYREDTIVILLRGKTVSMSSEKDLSVDGMRTDLLGLMQMITF